MKIKYLFILFLTGCSFSFQTAVSKMPDPLDPEIAQVLKNHNDTIAVLVEDYKKRNPEVKDGAKK